jgi:hypothetical protein
MARLETTVDQALIVPPPVSASPGYSLLQRATSASGGRKFSYGRRDKSRWLGWTFRGSRRVEVYGEGLRSRDIVRHGWFLSRLTIS